MERGPREEAIEVTEDGRGRAVFEDGDEVGPGGNAGAAQRGSRGR